MDAHPSESAEGSISERGVWWPNCLGTAMVSVGEEEELKHDLNELCKYVHKLFGYCEGARRATDLVVLDIGRLRKTV